MDNIRISGKQQSFKNIEEEDYDLEMNLENNTPLHLALNKLTPMMDGLEDYEDLDMDMDMDVCMVK